MMMKISCKDYKQLVGDLALLQCQLKSREKAARLQRQQIDQLKVRNTELEQCAKCFQEERNKFNEDIDIERSRFNNLEITHENLKLEQELDSSLRVQQDQEIQILR